MKTPTELSELFRQRGLKVTPQRQCIFRLLHGNHAHPTAEALYAAVSAEMPTISLKTVYSTLNDLAAMGEIQQLDLGTGSSRFDPNVERPPPPRVQPLRQGPRRVRRGSRSRVPDAQLEGFTVDTTEVVFRGRLRPLFHRPVLPSNRLATRRAPHG